MTAYMMVLFDSQDESHELAMELAERGRYRSVTTGWYDPMNYGKNLPEPTLGQMIETGLLPEPDFDSEEFVPVSEDEMRKVLSHIVRDGEDAKQ